MSDVFISYARSTATQAQLVAEALRALGYGVWRDDDLPAHKPYAEVIEERLAAAKAVVVIWSAEAAGWRAGCELLAMTPRLRRRTNPTPRSWLVVRRRTASWCREAGGSSNRRPPRVRPFC